MIKVIIPLELTKTTSKLDDVGERECDICEKICKCKDEEWFDGDLGTKGISVCEACISKIKTLKHDRWQDLDHIVRE